MGLSATSLKLQVGCAKQLLGAVQENRCNRNIKVSQIIAETT
jgi:hypothetical protein